VGIEKWSGEKKRIPPEGGGRMGGAWRGSHLNPGLKFRFPGGKKIYGLPCNLGKPRKGLTKNARKKTLPVKGVR